MNPNDNGYASRKLWFSIGTSALIVIGAAVVGFLPSAAPVYPEMVMGLLGVLTVFVGGNLGAKFLTGKTLVNSTGSEDPSGESQLPQETPDTPEQK